MSPAVPPDAILFRRARLVTRDRVLEPWSLLARDGRIEALMPDAEAVAPPGAAVVDLAGRTLCPGFIDVHVHGIGPDHMMRTDRFPAMMRAMAAGGATGCLPSVGMFTPPQYGAYLEAVARVQAAPTPGCEVLGAHFESPYINPECICIQPDLLWAPCPDEYRHWLDEPPGVLLMMTLSPELPGAFDLVQALTRAGAAASIGHSLADQAQLRRAMAAGLRCACHLFDNVPIRHLSRENCLQHPCMDEFVLLEDELYAEVIPDGIHVAPPFLQLVRKLKGPDRVILVTDAQPGAGLPEGIYRLPDGRAFRTRPGDVARLVGSTQIVGSSLTMIEAVRGYRRHTGAGLAEAVRAASLNPARMLGLDRELGSLEPGKRANLVVLDDTGVVAATYVRGRCVWRRAAGGARADSLSNKTRNTHRTDTERGAKRSHKRSAATPGETT